MPQQPVIRVLNLNKVYKLYDQAIDRMKEALSLTKKRYHREYFALKNISFEIFKGETVGIVGTNGSGKSTLLKIITRVITPTSGLVDVQGRVSALLELGAGFNPEYTGRENIYLNGTMMGYSHHDMEIRSKKIEEFADIGEFIDQPVKNYSSGMFARLAFAVAINVEPDILIIDEALSVGDVFFQNKCFKKFEELKKQGITILFVSHDVESVKQMCSRVLWIDQGEQKMFGDKRSVCNAYSNSIKLKYGRNGILQYNPLPGDSYKLSEIKMKNFPVITYAKESLLHPEVKILSAFFQDKNQKVTTELQVGEY